MDNKKMVQWFILHTNGERITDNNITGLTG